MEPTRLKLTGILAFAAASLAFFQHCGFVFQFLIDGRIFNNCRVVSPAVMAKGFLDRVPAW